MVGKWRSWSVAGTTLLATGTRTCGNPESSCGLGAAACGARKSGSASSCQNLSVENDVFFNVFLVSAINIHCQKDWQKYGQMLR